MRTRHEGRSTVRSLSLVPLAVAALSSLGLAASVGLLGCSLEICEVAQCNAQASGGGGQGGEGGGGGPSCDPACAPGANATAECVNGSCVYTCDEGYGDCDADPSDCEVDLRSDEHCGACGRACAVECGEVGGAVACNDPVEIAAGYEHTCVRKAAGSVYCWGDNGLGQVGSGTGTAQSLPQRVPFGADIRATSLVAGGHTGCILDTTGAVQCWGDSNPGDAPRIVPDAEGASRVAIYSERGVFLRGNQGSEFTLDDLSAPSTLLFTGGSAVAMGRDHGCALRPAGAVACWGGNGSGQLGLADTARNLTQPTISIPGLQATAIATGEDHSCAIAANKQLHCWGASVDYGQVGHGEFANATAPQPVLADVDLVKLGCCTSGARVGNQLYLWGRNDARQVSSSSSSAIAVPTLYATKQNDVVDFALGRSHTCVITRASEVECFGDNATGQLGNGTQQPVVGNVTVTIPRD